MKKIERGDQVLTATKSIDVSRIGLTDKNCAAVHTQAAPYKSYVPGREINSLRQLEEGKTYLFKMKKAAHLRANLTNGEV